MYFFFSFLLFCVFSLFSPFFCFLAIIIIDEIYRKPRDEGLAKSFEELGFLSSQILESEQPSALSYANNKRRRVKGLVSLTTRK